MSKEILAIFRYLAKGKIQERRVSACPENDSYSTLKTSFRGIYKGREGEGSTDRDSTTREVIDMHVLAFIIATVVGNVVSYLLELHGTLQPGDHFFVGLYTGIIASGVSDYVRDYYIIKGRGE